ncbi:hypothetical protein [uncultured Sphingomonas sp.]|uniref:hypothetical protein n=1 Tax=uncultured Sphingomonas sp. TaxID=158754 RepID=UPI0025E12E3E|nr:hypothetical protein [uncultured Sphingomonas sp.]
MSLRPEMKRYTYRLLLTFCVYAVALVGANMWFRHAPPTGLLAYVVALLPALPIIGVFAVIARLLIEMRDEYVRMLLVRQSLVATGFMLSVVTAWGFLEDFGLAPHTQSYYATVLWFGGLGLGGCLNAFLEGRAAR